MDKDVLAKMVDQHKSSYRIAKELGIGKTTVQYWLNKFGLKTKSREYKCQCGQTDPAKFYGNKKRICAKCQTRYNTIRGHQKRSKGIKYLGGKCCRCGYNRNIAALDFHHLDPKRKDKNFAYKRGWSWDKLKEELNGCILLCRNCHAEEHCPQLNNLLEIEQQVVLEKSWINRTRVVDGGSLTMSCAVCSNEFKIRESEEANRRTCSEHCASIFRRKVQRPSKEVLEQETKTTPFTRLGKKYGVSDNAVRKWCKKYGLDHKSRRSLMGKATGRQPV